MSASDRIALVAFVACCACADAVTVPDPPDMSPLVARYAAPNGAFDAKNPGVLLDHASSQLAVLAGGDASKFLSSIMSVIAKRIDATGLDSNGGMIHMDGVLSLDVACPDDRGSVAVTTVLRDNELSRVVWGSAVHCAIDSELTIDGSVTIYRYAALDAKASEASFLVRVDGTVTGGDKAETALDFRVTAGALETRIATSAGDVIVARHGTDLAIRAANGQFTCSFTRRSCRAAS